MDITSDNIASAPGATKRLGQIVLRKAGKPAAVPPFGIPAGRPAIGWREEGGVLDGTLIRDALGAALLSGVVGTGTG